MSGHSETLQEPGLVHLCKVVLGSISDILERHVYTFACQLVSGNAVLGKASVTNPCSPSHLLGILHSTSQCQHLRASIHQGFNYKKKGVNSGCILQSTTFVNIACNIVYIAVLNPNKIHKSPGQPKVWWILLHRPWCKMESSSFI